MERHFVFDFGAVLFRWQPDQLLRRALPHRASDDASTRHWVAQVFQNYRGDWGEFDRGTVSVEQLTERIIARTGLTAPEMQALLDAVPHELAPIAASVDLLARLRATGRSLFYLSNMPAPFAAHLERAHEFVGWFADGVFSSRVKLIKPQPEIFDLCSRRFGVEPSQLVFLDDHPTNVVAARQAGWNAVQFSDAAGCERELRQLGLWPA